MTVMDCAGTGHDAYCAGTGHDAYCGVCLLRVFIQGALGFRGALELLVPCGCIDSTTCAACSAQGILGVRRALHSQMWAVLHVWLGIARASMVGYMSPDITQGRASIACAS